MTIIRSIAKQASNGVNWSQRMKEVVIVVFFEKERLGLVEERSHGERPCDLNTI